MSESEKNNSFIENECEESSSDHSISSESSIAPSSVEEEIFEHVVKVSCKEK